MSYQKFLYFTGVVFDSSQFKIGYKRLFLPVALLALIATPATREVVIATLSDSFWAVACYVAATLSVYHYFSSVLTSQNVIARLYHRSRDHQVLFAALLGALPGCGGAIVVATQFIQGRVGFGSLVAVLTATMGDAAFLLLASEPKTGFLVVSVGVVVGVVTGWVVNAIHDDGFLRPKTKQHHALSQACCREGDGNEQNDTAINLQGLLWKVLLVPGAFIALALSFQIDVNAAFRLPENTIEVIGACLVIANLLLWSLTREINSYEATVSEDKKQKSLHPIQKTAQDTNFITAWVVIAFLAFELTNLVFPFELGTWSNQWVMALPLLGVLFGLLPGCGPQILITSLYLSGVVPLSAQISNALSNDGDALFPVLAIAPKAALVATLYSAVPALIVGYGFFFLFE